MQKPGFTTKFIAAAVMMLGFTVTAQAGADITYVSTTGKDKNVKVDCSASAACRTLAAALSVTNSGGEIVVLNSGGYGSASITQPARITVLGGVDASITQTTAGDNALTINTTGNVTITGLNLRGGGTGSDGILVNQVGFLRLYSMAIQNFANNGVHFTSASSNLAIYDSNLEGCGHDGLLLQAAGAQAYAHDTNFDNNAFAGADASQGLLAIADSSAHYNQYGFFANGGTVTLYGDRAIFNTNGLAANATGSLYFAGCLVSDNTNAYNVASGGVVSGSSPGSSLIAPGQSTVGSPSPGITLQ